MLLPPGYPATSGELLAGGLDTLLRGVHDDASIYESCPRNRYGRINLGLVIAGSSDRRRNPTLRFTITDLDAVDLE